MLVCCCVVCLCNVSHYMLSSMLANLHMNTSLPLTVFKLMDRFCVNRIVVYGTRISRSQHHQADPVCGVKAVHLHIEHNRQSISR